MDLAILHVHVVECQLYYSGSSISSIRINNNKNNRKQIAFVHIALIDYANQLPMCSSDKLWKPKANSTEKKDLESNDDAPEAKMVAFTHFFLPFSQFTIKLPVSWKVLFFPSFLISVEQYSFENFSLPLSSFTAINLLIFQLEYWPIQNRTKQMKGWKKKKKIEKKKREKHQNLIDQKQRLETMSKLSSLQQHYQSLVRLCALSHLNVYTPKEVDKIVISC